MRLWDAPQTSFLYSLDEVVAAFWDRYPNSHAGHILSEDVLDRKITEHSITTKKLIVKQGSSILKRVPRWLSKMTHIRTVPVIEESVYDRKTRTLNTYTRNVSHNELFTMHEKCIYKPTPECLNFPTTDLFRSVHITIDCGKMSSFYEKVLLMGFKKSRATVQLVVAAVRNKDFVRQSAPSHADRIKIANTFKGMNEKLEDRFGIRSTKGAPSEKLKIIKAKLKSSLVTEAKCDE